MVGEGRQPVLARWHDGRWQRLAIPAIASGGVPGFFHVLALASGVARVTGGLSTGDAEIPLALRYQHGKWRRFQGRGGDFLGQAIPDGTGGIWAAYFSADDLTTMVHLDAGRWHQVSLPKLRGKHTSVTALARVPRSGAVFALGDLFWGAKPVRTEGLILEHA